MKYLLIDGNNLAIRSAFASQELTSSGGVPTGVHYGTLNSLISLKQKYPDSQFLLVWDGHSSRRIAEAEEGIKRNIVSSGYKANRKKDEQPKPLLDFYSQSPFLKRAIEQTGIPQIRLENFEADDVIASYCSKFKRDSEVVCVTSDSDYFQLLDENVTIYDGMKQKLITKEDWEKENGITTRQYLDKEALCGDDGDNIHGVPSIGEKTALKIIQEFGSWEKALDSYKTKLASYRLAFPDLNAEDFDKLRKIETETKKPRYPEITINMPFTGVALAIETKKIKEKIPKSTIMSVMFEERIKLAYSLKKMDCINSLPDIVQGKSDMVKLEEYCDYYEMYSLKSSLNVFG